MAVLVALSAIGSALALLVLLAVGYLHSGQEFVRYLTSTLKVSTMITLVFGVFGTLIELLQVRLNRRAPWSAAPPSRRGELRLRRVTFCSSTSRCRG